MPVGCEAYGRIDNRVKIPGGPAAVTSDESPRHINHFAIASRRAGRRGKVGPVGRPRSQKTCSSRPSIPPVERRGGLLRKTTAWGPWNFRRSACVTGRLQRQHHPSEARRREASSASCISHESRPKFSYCTELRPATPCVRFRTILQYKHDFSHICFCSLVVWWRHPPRIGGIHCPRGGQFGGLPVPQQDLPPRQGEGS